MKDMKIQTGLRVPEKRYAELLAMAKDMGVSLNSLILILIDIGVAAVNLGTQARSHELLRTLKDTVE